MTRKEMLIFAHEIVGWCQGRIKDAVAEGALYNETDYPWQEMFAEYTGIEIKTIEDLKNLSDEELKQIRESFV